MPRKAVMPAPSVATPLFGSSTIHPYFIVRDSTIGTSNVAGGMRTFCESGKDTMIFALPLIASFGTRTGPSNQKGSHQVSVSLKLIRFVSPSLHGKSMSACASRFWFGFLVASLVSPTNVGPLPKPGVPARTLNQFAESFLFKGLGSWPRTKCAGSNKRNVNGPAK